MEKSVEWRSPLYLVLVEKAIDALSHATIWSALPCKGVPTKTINLIKTLNNNASCCVLHETQLGKSNKIKAGVRKGCVLLPLLFNCVLDVVMSKSAIHTIGFTRGLQDRLEDLDYTDDICLLSHSFSDMQSKLNLPRGVRGRHILLRFYHLKTFRYEFVTCKPSKNKYLFNFT